ncbi:MAG: helix-turn-helix transcriptional regulator [Bacteroidales bacterium]|nr:helix-turn-helix transcriptional regulator [Bacteroidales bacterium]
MNPCFAIIEPNTLTSMSLCDMLQDIYNNVEVLSYGSIDDYIRDSNRHFVHFFVNDAILFSQISEFETLKQQTTVLAEGINRHFEEAGFHLIDLTRPEQEIKSRLFNLRLINDYSDQSRPPKTRGLRNRLSEREKEVLRLMVKGLINKEIANQLEISLPTVIFHRNNICEKLQTRSIGRLTIFAVLSGIIDIDEI